MGRDEFVNDLPSEELDGRGRNLLSPYYLFRHKKSGGIYKLLHTGKLEWTLQKVVIYTKASGGDTVWVRPLTEWLDGRFEIVDGEKAR